MYQATAQTSQINPINSLLVVGIIVAVIALLA